MKSIFSIFPKGSIYLFGSMWLCASSLAFSNSFSGYWVSDKDKTLEFNILHTKLPDAELEYLKKNLGRMYIINNEKNMCQIMIREDKEKDSDNVVKNKYEWLFNYSVVAEQGSIFIIKTSSQKPEDYLDSLLRIFYFEDSDSFWIYDGFSPVNNHEHYREYFKRIYEADALKDGVSSQMCYKNIPDGLKIKQ